MSDTLDSLHHATIANPSDRTVRLVYADALDETGEPVNVARAEFIRAQIEAENSTEDAYRFGELSHRCGELFEANWLAWWSPVAKAAGLPAPHVPGKRVRDRIASAVRRRRRPANWPYTHTTAETTVHLAEYGLAFRFAGGFPEEVRFLSFDVPEGMSALAHRWGDGIPLRKLVFSSYVNAIEWERVNGPHLARLTDLIFERLVPDAVPLVAESPYLANITHLAVGVLGSDNDAIRGLVSLREWTDLRVLRLTGRTSPDGVQELARACTLRNLEHLELWLGNPGLLGNQLLEAASQILRMVIRAVAFPSVEAPRWIEYGPAFEALAAADWVRGLRILRIVSGHASGLMGLVSERLYGGTDAVTDVIPDAAVLALASALHPDKLERLALPAALIGPSVREELTTRMGSRVVFT